MLTGWCPSLPKLVIIGVNKGGTSALFEYLSQHPQVIPAATKEVHFFDFNYHRGLNWYKAHFLVPKKQLINVPVEATPSYFDHPLVPARAARDLSDARFIVLLRDPVARAYSHYWHERRYGRITLPFSQALNQEIDRIQRERQSGIDVPWDFRRFLRRSIYSPSLRRWMAAVPRERLLVLRSEDLQNDALGQLAKVCEFAELAPWENFDVSPRNVGSYSRSLPDQLAERMRELLGEDCCEVRALLGENFVWP